MNNNYIDEVLDESKRIFMNDVECGSGDNLLKYIKQSLKAQEAKLREEFNKDLERKDLHCFETIEESNAEHQKDCDQLVEQNNMVLDEQKAEHQKELRELRDKVQAESEEALEFIMQSQNAEIEQAIADTKKEIGEELIDDYNNGCKPNETRLDFIERITGVKIN